MLSPLPITVTPEAFSLFVNKNMQCAVAVTKTLLVCCQTLCQGIRFRIDSTTYLSLFLSQNIFDDKNFSLHLKLIFIVMQGITIQYNSLTHIRTHTDKHTHTHTFMEMSYIFWFLSPLSLVDVQKWKSSLPLLSGVLLICVSVISRMYELTRVVYGNRELGGFV